MLSSKRRQTRHIFVSYQLDSRLAVEDIHHHLVNEGITCQLDPVFSCLTAPGCVASRDDLGTRPSSRQSSTALRDSRPVGSIARSLRYPASASQVNIRSSAVAIICITSKYLQSSVCLQQLIQADEVGCHIVPVMLTFSVWPPEVCTSRVRKILARYVPIDLSNDKTYSRNMKVLIGTLNKALKSL